jgi:hypothetical protein
MSEFYKNLKFAWDYFVLGRHRSAPPAQTNPWIEPTPLESQLWFGDLLVADLHRMSPHQGTWFSEYQLRISSDQGELQNQLLAYITFCGDFHRRIAEGRDHNFDEFNRFTSIPDCKSWSASLPSGQTVPMEGRMWFTDGDVSWQHPQTEPSTEAAANEFWIQNAPRLSDNQT